MQRKERKMSTTRVEDTVNNLYQSRSSFEPTVEKNCPFYIRVSVGRGSTV